MRVFIVALAGVCLIGSVVQAEDPPAPTVTVLVYYDGTPSLAEARTEALAGFVEDADYLPVVETADALLFEDAIAAGDYQVYVAIASDGAAIEQWAADVKAGTANFAGFHPDPDNPGKFAITMLMQQVLDVSPPPPGVWPDVRIQPSGATAGIAPAGANADPGDSQGGAAGFFLKSAFDPTALF